MSHILTYPFERGYSSNLTTFRSQVKDGQRGSLPINDEIHRGDYAQNTGGVNWVASNGGDDNMDDAAGNYVLSRTATAEDCITRSILIQTVPTGHVGLT